MNPHQIIESLFRDVSWKDGETGYIQCPGHHCHTGKSSPKDCKIHLDGAPTIFCFHQSCFGMVEKANYSMRRALWEGSGENRKPFTELGDKEKALIRERMQAKQVADRLTSWALKHKGKIIKDHWWPEADVFHESPRMTDSPEQDYNAMLSLFDQDAVLWMGEPTDSGTGKGAHFRTVKEFLTVESIGHFTTPAYFKPGSESRSNENVIGRPFLVVESDTLTKDESLSIYKWMKGFMRLKAIVSTGGKSIHGWFDFPSIGLYEKLKVMLPELDCDRALFKPSQPVRMPGVMRGDKWQCLYYFNP